MNRPSASPDICGIDLPTHRTHGCLVRVQCLFLLSALLMPSCSRKSADTPPKDGYTHNVATNNLPFAVTVVEIDESQEWRRLAAVALTYFQKHDYDELEKLAEEGRSASDAWPDGNWRVVPVYIGLELSSEQADSAWLARQDALKAWIAARPESITARVALARNLMAYAWKARGTGYANTVSDEGERLFEERLGQAASVLTEAKDLKARCPVYWTTLMKVALGLGLNKTQFDRICQHTWEAYPDYTPAYVQRGVYLLPRWYGEEGEWVADLADSADKLGGEKGDILYAQVAWSLRGYSEKKNVFEDNEKLSWKRVDRGWDALEKKFPDSLEAVHVHGHMAGLAGDREKARKCLMKTEGKVTLSVWSSKGEFVDFANWALGQ